MKCRILVTITKYPQASIELIQEIKDHIFAIIKDNEIRKTYREEMEKTSIIRQLYIKLNNETLKEDELREIIKMTLTIETNSEKYKNLVSIAEHPQTSLKFLQNIKYAISDYFHRSAYKDIFDKINARKSEIKNNNY